MDRRVALGLMLVLFIGIVGFHMIKKQPTLKTLKRPIYVVQLHDARTLHYDFRIEIDGVLVSWAVPKGPSTDPNIKRLAIPTEDHDLAYALFEGMIPPGHYGAGTVMVWDLGTYTNLKQKSIQSCYEDGQIEIFIEGEKLVGAYALIKTKPTASDKEQWLLIKMKDEYAKKYTITNKKKSVLSGRTLQQIKKEKSNHAL